MDKFTLIGVGRTRTRGFYEIQIFEALPPNFDSDNIFPGDQLSENLKTKVYNAFSLRFPPGSLDIPISPADSDKILGYPSYPLSPIKRPRLESGASISETPTPLVRLNATSFPLDSCIFKHSGVDVPGSDEEGGPMAAPLVRQNTCSFFSCEVVYGSGLKIPAGLTCCCMLCALTNVFGIFMKRCVFIILMTTASDPPNSVFLSEKYCCFGDKKDFQFGQSILNLMNSCVKSFCF